MARVKLVRKRAKRPDPEKGKNFSVTPEMKRRVEALVMAGYTTEEIAAMLINPHTGRPIQPNTVRAHFSYEIKFGRLRMGSLAVETILRVALGNPNVYNAQGVLVLGEREPNLGALKMVLSKSIGWKDDATAVTFPGPLIVVQDEAPDENE